MIIYHNLVEDHFETTAEGRKMSKQSTIVFQLAEACGLD